MDTVSPAWYTLANDLERQIRARVWKGGDRFPSLREIRRRTGRSLNTVIHAYRELEKRGVIEARERSGYFVCIPGRRTEPPRRATLPLQSAPVEVHALTETIVTDSLDPGLIPFGSSTLDPSLLPVKSIARLVRGLSEEEWYGAVNYAPSAGAELFRRRIAGRYAALLPGISPDDVVITAGCAEAVALSLAAMAEPGTTVAVESPTHFGTLQMLRDRGYRVLEIAVDARYGIDPAELERAFRAVRPAAAILSPTVHNPTGAITADERKREIVRVAAEAGIPVIEDQIYGDMVHDGNPALPLAHWGDGIITCSSFSKTVAPGFRIGWAISRKHARRIARIKASHSLASPTLEQSVLARYISSGSLDRHLSQLRRNLRGIVAAYGAGIAASFPAGTRVTNPRGGNFFWIELPDGVDAVTVYRRARERGIVVVPGAAFSASGGYGNYLRFSAPAPLNERYERAIETLGALVARFAERTG